MTIFCALNFISISSNFSNSKCLNSLGVTIH
jgi:hypothetical protein